MRTLYKPSAVPGLEASYEFVAMNTRLVHPLKAMKQDIVLTTFSSVSSKIRDSREQKIISLDSEGLDEKV
ncbi:hypothetical protein TNCV_3228291 [Trichonephila clavipes]|nr:hypothetical protein TNCV_3228291 [Trichonephila clavipes]